jgi:hypothetical protein
VPLVDVPPELRYDPSQRPNVYTEAYATARNGDVSSDPSGKPQTAWPLDDPRVGRIAVRPHISDAHKQWLEKAYEDIAPALKAHGLSDGQCARASLACVGAAAEHAHWGAPERFAVSTDGAQVAAIYKDGRFTEIAVDKALQASAVEQLARFAQSERGGHQRMAPAGEATQAPEPALARRTDWANRRGQEPGVPGSNASVNGGPTFGSTRANWVKTAQSATMQG